MLCCHIRDAISATTRPSPAVPERTTANKLYERPTSPHGSTPLSLPLYSVRKRTEKEKTRTNNVVFARVPRRDGNLAPRVDVFYGRLAAIVRTEFADGCYVLHLLGLEVTGAAFEGRLGLGPSRSSFVFQLCQPGWLGGCDHSFFHICACDAYVCSLAEMPVPNKPAVSVDVKQHLTTTSADCEGKCCNLFGRAEILYR